MEQTAVDMNTSIPRPHHRVLKPPGGGSHDIFGTGLGQMVDTSHDYRRVKYQESNVVIGSNDYSNSPSRPEVVSPTNGTSNAAAGLPSAKPSNLGKIIRGENGAECDTDNGPTTPERKVKDHMRSSVFGESDGQGMASVTGIPRRPQGRGNPITGEGYVGGSPQCGEGNPQSGRKPPGGHSQVKLW